MIEKMKINKPKKDYSIFARVSDIEFKMFLQVCGKLGIGQGELVRRMIEEKFNKTFPPYSTRKEATGAHNEIDPNKVEITDEQFCEANGGKVVTNAGGGKSCELFNGISTMIIPLSDRDGIQFRAKQMELI